MRSLRVITRNPVSSVSQLLQDVARLRGSIERRGVGHTWYFRGDRAGPLRPSIGNPTKEYAGRSILLEPQHEVRLLNRFRRFAYQHLGPNVGEWEALFLARHFEMPCRIMDWSASPLVALYFACAPMSRSATGRAVWGILRNPDETHDVPIFDPTKKPLSLFEPRTCAIKLIYPVYNSGRISAQKGIFTWHAAPRRSFQSLTTRRFEDDQLDISLLVKWPLEMRPAVLRLELVRDLERLGINQRTIFPDLQGIATGLWQTVVLFS